MTTAHGGAGTALTHANGFDVSGSPFAITRGTLTVNDGNAGNNYLIAYNGANLTLGAKTLTDSGFAVANKTYDGTTAATITADGDLTGVVSGDSVSLNNRGALASFGSKNAGSERATSSGYTLAGAQAADYMLTQPAATGNIMPAALAVVAHNESKTFGSANPSLIYSYSGLLGADTLAVFSGGLTTSATVSSNAGIYPIEQGTLSAGGNYSIRYTPGTLTVNSLPATVSAPSSDSALSRIAAPTDIDWDEHRNTRQLITIDPWLEAELNSPLLLLPHH